MKNFSLFFNVAKRWSVLFGTLAVVAVAASLTLQRTVSASAYKPPTSRFDYDPNTATRADVQSGASKSDVQVMGPIVSGDTDSTLAATTASFSEGFEALTDPPTGWVKKNQSGVIGTNTNCWNRFTTTPWSPRTGVGHIGANFNCTAGSNTISGWLITPTIDFNNGDQISFWTRKASPDTFPDRLELRLSLNGGSTNTGATATDVGDFTTVLLTVNPTLVTGVYPTAFTQFTATISGLPGTTTGRAAFRYFVTSGGPSGTNSDIISIDDFDYVAAPFACPAPAVYGYVGTTQTYTVPPGVTSIKIDGAGAQGGSVTTTCAATGGRGARMTGDFAVTPGEVLTILVGQQGRTNGSDAGGGGGTYIVRTGNVPLLVAGGGGGATNSIGQCGGNRDGIDASTSTSGTASANGIVAGGAGGNGGGASTGSGGGGGGFLTDGVAGTGLANNNGKSFLNGGAGGTGNNNDFGGYGGGGAGWFTGGNGGGGGGYSGGGTSGSQPFSGGGGGGSFNIGTNQTNTSGAQTGDGTVTITPIVCGPVNNPPTIGAVVNARQQGSPVSNSTIANVTDVESGNGGVTVTVNGGASATVNGVTVSNIVNTAGVVTANIVAACGASNATFTLTATDGDGAATNATLNVNVTANSTPTLIAPANITIPFGGSVTAQAEGSDNGTLTYSITSVTPALASAPSISPTGLISLSALGPVGVHTIVARATDNCGAFAEASFTVNVIPANTQTSVQTTINAPNYGSTLTATATVTAVAPGGGVPQGTVNFNDGGFAIAACQNVPVSALGSAVCSTTQLPAGTNKVIQAVYSGNANYNGSNGSATQTIGKAPLNVTASSHTVTYGDAAPSITSTITGFVLGESTANLGTQPTCSTTYTQGSPVSGSQYPTSCSGGVSNNYSFNYINGTVTVNKRALTVTADNKSRGYGAANPALTATLSGFIGSDNAANSTTGTAGLSTTATATSPVGNYPITATLGTLASGNYSFATFTNGTLSVTAVQLTVTANNQTRVYGAPNPTLTYSITGFVNGEGVGVLTGTPTITTSATATSAPGTYPITAAVGTLANPNYTFTTANGTLTVTQASTTTTITNAAALGNPTSAGQSYAVNWTTTPVAPATGTPTGNVTVSDGTQTCTAAVAAGTCSLTSTTSGTKTITATYAGDTNFAGSTSQAVQHNVVNGLTGNVKQFIAFGTNTNLAGVTMTLLNTATQQAVTTTTDANGNYSFSTALGQSYTITPSGLGKAFEATSRTYTNVAGNIAGADFIAYDVPGPNAIPRSARISSQIATQGQPVTLPVLITANGAETKVAFSVEYPAGPLGVPTVTCGTGAVNCTLSVNNSLSGKVGITVTPVAPLAAGTRELVKITFPTFTNPATSAQIKFGDSPTAKDVRNAENNPIPMLYWTDGLVSFTGGTLLDGATISGKVTTSAGQGLRNATVTLIDTAGGRRTTTTSSFGNYTFEGLELGRDYMIVVTSKRYRFATRTVNLTENLNGVDMIGLE